MTEARRRQILARYRSHAARFARDAASLERRGLTPEETAPAGAASGSPALSPREREVLALIAAGLTDAEIARRIALSEFTVKTHVKRLLTKLSARNRAHAVALAVHRGLLSL